MQYLSVPCTENIYYNKIYKKNKFKHLSTMTMYSYTKIINENSLLYHNN